MKRIIGILLLIAILAAPFIIVAFMAGIKVAVIAMIATIITTALICLAVYLII